MVIDVHIFSKLKIAEIVPDKVLFNIDEWLDIIGNLYYQGFHGVIINERSIAPSFFDLRSKIAGEVLQKFSNYNIRLTIVGKFTDLSSNSLTDFIYESNKGRHINFVDSTSEALKTFSI
ncbi:DUF4180 domain-containing protein [Sphingobacterium corticibacter]|uniref:DUF4180 domain-containing protein n=1 Tax=Sphingobacterium corticibacter TaxID=2171749 RepID=A0A2T8HFW2_9SPHI|nr:DUF4180 domain-containing protein [Sphingobacterium corticibacter]PVH24293.1 DUF4180 domain-containing protein [Sphingobacterium corticibacter]